MKSRPVKESTIEAGVVRHCKRRGLYCRKLTSPSSSGIPDRLICKDGKVLFLELKREKQKPTALQNYEIGLLVKAGMYATWTDNLVDAITIIDDWFFLDCV